MADVAFDVGDVKAKVEKDPWKRQEDFSDEINTEDMADTATQYAKAASEAGSAGELGEHASQQSAESGSYDGAELLDKEQRDSLTSQDLGDNGAQMDAVVGNILRAMATAMDAEDDVAGEIDGSGVAGGGLESRIETLSDLAVISHSSLKTQVESIPDISGTLSSSSPLVEKPQIIFGENTYEAVSDGGQGWTVPPKLATDIKKHYLDQAVEAAERIDGEIKEIISKYRRELNELGLELEEAGYDTSSGPLELWHSEEMAAYNGNKLNTELQKEEPDPEALELYSVGLGSAVDEIFDENGNVREDFDADDSERAEYVERFLEPLEADSLAALGNLDTSEGAPGAERILAAQAAVANGINTVMNPEVGGGTPTTDTEGRDLAGTPGRPRTPEGVAEFVYDYTNQLRTGFPDEAQGLVDSFNGFGNLMGQATVPTGDLFAADLIEAGVSFQEEVTNKNASLTLTGLTSDSQTTAPDNEDPLLNTGSSGILGAAALNSNASAQALSDPDMAERVLLEKWADSDGAGLLVKSASVPPAGTGMTEAHRDAAFNVMRISADPENHEAILGDPTGDNSFTSNSDITEVDHTSLQMAVADVTVNNLENIAENMAQSTTDADARALGHADRKNLFALMAKTDEAVNSGFKVGVYETQQDMAYDMFTGQGDNGPGSTFELIGRIDGLVKYGEMSALHEVHDEADKRAELGRKLATSTVAAAGALGPMGTAAATGSTALANGITLLGTGAGQLDGYVAKYEAEAPVKLGEYEAADNAKGDWAAKHAIATAAQQAHADAAADDGVTIRSDFYNPDVDTETQPLDYGPDTDKFLMDLPDADYYDYGGHFNSFDNGRDEAGDFDPKVDPTKLEEYEEEFLTQEEISEKEEQEAEQRQRNEEEAGRN